MTVIALFLAIYSTNIYCTVSQSNYTKFIATVCDVSNPYYDPCSCTMANYTSRGDNINCFNKFNCDYKIETNTFCSGHGYCDYTNGTCMCDKEYGSPDCSRKYELFLPNGVILTAMIVIASLLLLLSLLLVIWVHLYRDVGDVKAMSVAFTHLTLVGCTLICCGTIVMGLGFGEANCVILEWFHFLGICVVISCALLKSYRIASIFGQSDFSPSDLTDTVLLKYFSVMVAVDVFFLAIYTIFNFVEGGAYTRYLSADVLKETRCSGEPLTMLSYSLLVAWQLVLLLFVIKYGNQTRSASKIFKETKCIYVGSNIGSMFFIAFGIFVLFTSNYTLQIVIRGYGSLIVVSMVIGLLFYPKFKAVYNLRSLAKTMTLKKQITAHTVVDENGNVIDEEQAALKRQYEAHVKEPNGKELLLLLDALVKEIAYRANMKMLAIELNSVDLKQCNELLKDIQELIPEELKEKEMEMEKEKEKNDDDNDDEKDVSEQLQLNEENASVSTASNRALLNNNNNNNDDVDKEDKKISLNKTQSVQSESHNNAPTNTIGLEIDENNNNNNNTDYDK